MSVDPAVIEGLHDELRRHLAEFTSSDAWLNWLHGARQFHRYSPSNQLLLMLQGADGHVASYRTWQRIPAVDGGHCQVRKGEQGLTILAPLTLTRRDIDEASGDEIVVAGAVTRVPHGQGVPPRPTRRPTRPSRTSVADTAHRRRPLAARVGRGRRPARRRGIPGRAAHRPARRDLERPHPLRRPATSRSWTISTPRNASRPCSTNGPTSRCATATPTDPATRELLEIEAESVAYLLCRTIDLDSSSYSIPYLAGWADGDLELAEATAQRILTATAAMVDTLETRLSIDLTPDLFSATARPLHRRRHRCRSPTAAGLDRGRRP